MVLDHSSTIAIVGGSLAGLRAAETLRAEGHTGTVTLVGAELHLPYDRPPLSKQFLAGTWGLDRVLLRPSEKITALGLDLRLGHRAGALDVEGHTLELDDGSVLRFDGLVVATGAHPRPLPGAPRWPACTPCGRWRTRSLSGVPRAEKVSASWWWGPGS